VIVGDGAGVPPDQPSIYVPSAKPGGRAPHAWLKDGRSLFDAFGFDWTLLNFGAAALAAPFVAAARARGLGLRVLSLADEPVAADLYEAPLALIRPDQVVAWRGDSADPAALFNRVCGPACARVTA
jgi:hypothetical protein